MPRFSAGAHTHDLPDHKTLSTTHETRILKARRAGVDLPYSTVEGVQWMLRSR